MRHSHLVAAAVALLFCSPCIAQENAAVKRGPKIIATKVAPGCDGTVAILTVTLDPLTHSHYGTNLFFHFDPPSPGTQTSGGSTVVVKIPASLAATTNHFLSITTSSAATGGSSSGNYPFAVPTCGPAVKKGMTWRLITTNAPTGTVRVGCGQNECNAYQGDTACNVALPLLCIKNSGAGFPLPPPASVDDTYIYSKWADGIIGTTAAMLPPQTLTLADAECFKEFGADWRVAEFHDGWGWYFQAYGGVGDPSTRFRVHINDQPANCW